MRQTVEGGEQVLHRVVASTGRRSAGLRHGIIQFVCRAVQCEKIFGAESAESDLVNLAGPWHCGPPDREYRAWSQEINNFQKSTACFGMANRSSSARIASRKPS